MFAALGVLTLLVPAARGADAPISFSRELAPVLLDQCVACHGPEKQRGGYRLDSFEWLRKPGDNGEATIVAGDPERSALFKLITATDADDRMPQKSDPLPAAFIGVVRRWIKGGAAFDGENTKQTLADLLPEVVHPVPPEHYPPALPVLAVALLDQNRVVAIGGYREILLRSLPSGDLRSRLTNLPERIHALVPVVGKPQLIYAGGTPGRAGEVGLITLDGQSRGPGDAPNARRVLARSVDTFLTVAVSREGERVAVSGSDKIIRLIDLPAGRELRRLTQHADWVMALDFDAAAGRLVSASRDGTARVCDVKSGEMISTFRGHEGPVLGVAFLGDAAHAASVGRDGRVRFWKTDTGEQTGQTDVLGVDVLRLLRAGDDLLAAGADGQMRLVSTKSRKVERTWRIGQEAVFALAWASEPSLVLTGDAAGEIRLSTMGETSESAQFKAWP